MKLKDILKILNVSVFKIGDYELVVVDKNNKTLAYIVKADNNNKTVIIEVNNGNKT